MEATTVGVIPTAISGKQANTSTQTPQIVVSNRNVRMKVYITTTNHTKTVNNNNACSILSPVFVGKATGTW